MTTEFKEALDELNSYSVSDLDYLEACKKYGTQIRFALQIAHEQTLNPVPQQDDYIRLDVSFRGLGQRHKMTQFCTPQEFFATTVPFQWIEFQMPKMLNELVITLQKFYGVKE